MREKPGLYSMNRGMVSRYGLARIDIKRLALAAETQSNWIPKVLGPMMFRPGLGYIGGIYNDAPERLLPFIFATDDTALIELTDSLLRVWINDVILSRVAVTTTVTNGTFPADLTGWTSSDEAGATSAWAAPNYLQLVGNGTARAIRDQTVTVSGANVSKEHALRIVIARGPVTLRVGSTVGGDEYVTETTLLTGTHSLAFTPTGNFTIRFASAALRKTWVSQCTVEAAGVVTLPTPWTAAKLSSVRADQSGDILFAACAGLQQRRIERRGTRPGARSWSVTYYTANDGPLAVQNITPTTITPSGTTGNVTLTASIPLFRSTHVGALFSITSVGQAVSTTSATTGGVTSSIRVTGVTSARTFSIDISGDATGSTVDLERSFDNSTWGAVGGAYTWTANASTTYTDGLENQIVFYRLKLRIRVAPDSVTMSLRIGSGSIRGIVRITDYTNSTTVGAEVLTALGGASASSVWQEGQWSDAKGWPTAVRLHEGRLWWSGSNGSWGSISDAYDSFDETLLGDAGAINRTIGSGPVDTINWMLSLQRLLMGAQGAELSVRSTSIDEPLTPTNFHVKTASTQGSANVEPAVVDQMGYFVNRSGARLYELAFDIKSYDYVSSHITETVPEIGKPGIVRMAVQRQPDTRLHCVRSDGVVALLVSQRSEDVNAWGLIQTSGSIEDVVTLPATAGNTDDQVYYVVKRTINGATKRYLEKWAQEVDCRGDLPLCKLADAYVTYSGVLTTTITGLGHLEGRSVVVWADGSDVGTNDSARPWTQRYTVSGGQIALTAPASNVVVGLGYTGTFKSSKLGSMTQLGSPLNQQKRLGHIGLVLADTHPKGLQFGPTFDVLDDMPAMERGTTVSGVQASYDENLIEFPSTWQTDLRLCLQAQAPRPCTVMAVTPDIQAND